MNGRPDIDGVVFSGGGARCFWQAGFWEAVKPALPVPSVISAVSGGAAVAAILFAGGWSRFYAKFLELATDNDRNLRLRNLLRRHPVFPHPAISRESFLHAVSSRGLQALREGPDFRIVIAHPPRVLGARLAALLAVAVDEIERRLTGCMNSGWIRALGFRSSVVRARECETPDALVHAILQSSSAPPMFPITRRNGQAALDGRWSRTCPYPPLRSVAAPWCCFRDTSATCQPTEGRSTPVLPNPCLCRLGTSHLRTRWSRRSSLASATVRCSEDGCWGDASDLRGQRGRYHSGVTGYPNGVIHSLTKKVVALRKKHAMRNGAIGPGRDVIAAR